MSKAITAIGAILILFGLIGYGIFFYVASSASGTGVPPQTSIPTQSLIPTKLMVVIELLLYWLFALPAMFILAGIGLILAGRRLKASDIPVEAH